LKSYLTQRQKYSIVYKQCQIETCGKNLGMEGGEKSKGGSLLVGNGFTVNGQGVRNEPEEGIIGQYL
jgi:hypothetical protein